MGSQVAFPPVDTARCKKTQRRRNVSSSPEESPCNSAVKGADTARRRTHCERSESRGRSRARAWLRGYGHQTSPSQPQTPQRCGDKNYDDRPVRVDGIHLRWLARHHSICRCGCCCCCCSCRYPGLSALSGSKFQPGRTADPRISRRLGSSLTSMKTHTGST